MLTNAVKAARRAGAIINRASQDVGAIKVQTQTYNDFVSEVDRNAEQAIIDTLKEAYPTHGFWGEESGNDGKEAEHIWIIDPLDGTFYFANNRSDFAVHIALWERQSKAQANISVAAVSMPVFETVFDTKNVKVASKSNEIPRLLVSGSRPPLEMPKLTAIFDEVFGGVEIKSVGSVGAKVVQILEGKADLYVHTTGFYEWDIAAPLAVAIAGGLVVCDIKGKPLQLNQENLRVDNVIVCKPELLEVVLQAVS